jgi:lipopolysaccharide export system protein LptC
MRERGTLVSSLVLLSALAGGSYWLALRARLLDPVAKTAKHEIDYYATEFEMVRMDDQGHPYYRLGAKRMEHYADDDSTDLARPSITSLSPDKPVVHITGRTGDVSSGGDLVHLDGDVKLIREATTTDPGLVADSAHMTVLPDENIAKTNTPVHAVHGGSTMDGDSMWFSDTDHLLKLNDGATSGRTYLTIEPQQKKNAPKPPTPQ